MIGRRGEQDWRGRRLLVPAVEALDVAARVVGLEGHDLLGAAQVPDGVGPARPAQHVAHRVERLVERPAPDLKDLEPHGVGGHLGHTARLVEVDYVDSAPGTRTWAPHPEP